MIKNYFFYMVLVLGGVRGVKQCQGSNLDCHTARKVLYNLSHFLANTLRGVT